MEQYANYGFYTIEEKIKNNPNYFYKNTGFLDMILDLLVPISNSSDVEIEELYNKLKYYVRISKHRIQILVAR